MRALDVYPGHASCGADREVLLAVYTLMYMLVETSGGVGLNFGVFWPDDTYVQYVCSSCFGASRRGFRIMHVD